MNILITIINKNKKKLITKIFYQSHNKPKRQPLNEELIRLPIRTQSVIIMHCNTTPKAYKAESV